MNKKERMQIRRDVDKAFDELGVKTFQDYLRKVKGYQSPEKIIELGKYVDKSYKEQISEINKRPKNMPEWSSFANLNLMATGMFLGGLPAMVTAENYLNYQADDAFKFSMLAVAGGTAAFYCLSKGIANGVYKGKNAIEKYLIERRARNNRKMMYGAKYALKRVDEMKKVSECLDYFEQEM